MHRLRVGRGKQSGQPDDAADRSRQAPWRGANGRRRGGAAWIFQHPAIAPQRAEPKRHSAAAAHRASKAARAKRALSGPAQTPVLHASATPKLSPLASAKRSKPPPRDWSRTADERKTRRGGGPLEPRRRETEYWREEPAPYDRRRELPSPDKKGRASTTMPVFGASTSISTELSVYLTIATCDGSLAVAQGAARALPEPLRIAEARGLDTFLAGAHGDGDRREDQPGLTDRSRLRCAGSKSGSTCSSSTSSLSTGLISERKIDSRRGLAELIDIQAIACDRVPRLLAAECRAGAPSEADRVPNIRARASAARRLL